MSDTMSEVFAAPYGPFNQLTPAQVERLAILSEELGEVQQVIGKILRHGYDSHNPVITVPEDERPATNQELLEQELGDVLYAFGMIVVDKDISLPSILSAATLKKERVKKYLHHNKD